MGFMTLQKWCERFGRGAKAFLAQHTDKQWATIHYIVEGKTSPSVDTAKAIERATKGKVPWTSIVRADSH
jgi:hypothetical protein